MFGGDKTIMLDTIFDPAKGWEFSVNQVPLQRDTTSEGHPYYIVKVDTIEILVFEQTEWEAGVVRKVPATRLVAMTTFTGVELTNAKALLEGGYSTRGLPSFGLNEEGQITLHTAFPIAEGFPVDLARRQLMVCMGIISEEAKELLKAWNENSEEEFDWNKAKKVASVGGSFLRALLGLG